MGLRLETENLKGFVEQKDIQALNEDVKRAHEQLEGGTGAGSDFTGWLHLPSLVKDGFLDELVALGKEVRSYSDCLISIGIGGSYLGIRSTLEFLRGEAKLPVYYAGHNMSVDYMQALMEEVRDKDVSVVVISKSGTTTEPALAFRIIKEFLKKKYTEQELQKRIICVTDAKKGALRKIADQCGYRTYVIPDDVGGRFSVLTPVGLVPLAIAGVDVKSLVKGARAAEKEYSIAGVSNNTAHAYAAARFQLFQKGKLIEVLSSFYDNMLSVNEWWKQLFGESEGKNGKGIFPASLILSTDLHSMGQLMQDGVRNIFETFVDIERSNHQIHIPKDPENIDGFNCVAGKDLDFVNKQAYKATAAAHYEGGVPNMTIVLDKPDAFHLGQLYYFFEKAVAVSGYLLSVNPFDQPGVESYKKKMFDLIGK
ncbi:MAG TPA: glucose-6-phosphate isomerase [Candidatus Omnitrophota bacterium]|jgi:glucose-6-phosphate isomerase|nr:glucose-6-phosphate isomerase [Candidatus Omnitrophota bacterium]HSA30174.1 glucose-6-phosphate isomerase [Candidatus Omnitrophota bacterium]